MALLQIAEPGQSTAPHQHKLAIGIDLGTTNSLVASVISGKAQTLADDSGKHILPSVVHYSESTVEVGDEALSHAINDPFNTIVSVKRLMGRGVGDLKLLAGHMPYEFTDVETSLPKIKTRQGDVSSIEVSSEILKVLSQRAINTLGGDLLGAVITVPAYFDDAQRQATKDAARLAKINVLRLLNEPTAAAVAYGLDTGKEGIIAVYDFGGGTFDISILRLNKGIFEVLATGGDSALGGDDFDHAIAEWMIESSGFYPENNMSLVRELLHKARSAKELLSKNESTEIELSLDDKKWKGKLTREVLETLIDSLIKKTILSCRRALRDADVSIEYVNEVVMVGGSTRTLRVREQVGEFFKMQPLTNIDPDKVVAIGASIQANTLAGNNPDNEMLLLDVIPLSLGLETMGGLTEKVIHKNTPIPVSRAQDFTTYKDGQTALAVHVVQGERELVSDCRSLAHFELRGFTPQVAGATRIRVTFQVDADGLLSVSALEKNSKVEASVDVKPSYGLTDSEIEKMLLDSIEHAEEDMSSRSLREQQVEADRVIEAIDAALASDAESLLNANEIEEIQTAKQKLISIKELENESDIKNAINSLEQVSEVFVQRRMNTSIKMAMQGHSIDEYVSHDEEK